MTENKKQKKKEKSSEKKISKKEIVKENEILTWVFIIVALVFLVIIALFFISKSFQYSKYKDVVEFQTIQEGDLIFYKTLVNVKEGNTLKPYNFYLRTKPKDLEKVPFEDAGNFTLMMITGVNLEDDLICDGDGTIAIANWATLNKVIGTEFYLDKNVTCDEMGRYNYFYIRKGNETKVEKIGENCYNIDVKDCEILPATEKIMAETFLRLK